ncbi:MAG: hypothetical protein HY671_10680 [Chloroflexi bacterium]|nr:hypothetical protein [Chloroflexota bacterium]
MPITEHTINDSLAAVLAETRSLWRTEGIVRAENIEILKGGARRPDILVDEPSVSPVVIETEVMPAASVETDAVQRLGSQVLPSGRPILSSLAVRMPLRLRDRSGQSLKLEIAAASDFEMALYTGEIPDKYVRWPRTGWLRGNAIDMSILVQSASVPPAVIDKAADRLESGVTEAAALFNEMAKTHPGAAQKVCQELRQKDVKQTREMAMTILANALVFHQSLAGGPGGLADIANLDELRGASGTINKADLLDQWRRILKVNYWPIFHIARRILEIVPGPGAGALIQRLAVTAQQLVENRLMQSHDLTGAVFQRLIADRKFLAAFYTHPASAALLIGLAIRPDKTPGNGSWSNREDITNLRVADFACGTGTLLSTAYRRISQIHEAAGGDAEALHPLMMATALVGVDVLPSNAHLTASILAGAHPQVNYEDSSVMYAEYGPRADGGVDLGSLDLLSPQGTLGFIPITAKAVEGKGQTRRGIRATLPHMSFDLIIMNPPFTRDTGQEAAKIGVPNPMFAAFGFSAVQQRAMATASQNLLRGTSARGNAGEASAFLVLADRKLKDSGTLALVMPLSLMQGEAWEESRQLLRKLYSDLIFVSIAGARDDELAFSADTGMGECLVIGRKTPQESKRATFVILRQRPDSQILGAGAADQVRKAIAGNVRKLEDGPVGGSPLRFGDDVIGFAIDAPIPENGPLHLVRISDAALAQVAHQMTDCGLIWLPGMAKSSAISASISTLEKTGGKMGPYHMDVNGDTPDGGIRGPFQIERLKMKAAPTYPVLWSHNAERERCMVFEADSEGVIRKGANPDEEAAVRSKADRIWATASHCHFNRDFRFNSQSTAMQFTSKRTIGGRAWPSISLNSPDQERALTLWANSSLGILLHWWHANKQQAGRGSIGVSALDSLPVLDVTALSPQSLSKAAAIFEDMKHGELRPVNEIDRDAVRAEIDARIATEVLGFPPELVMPDGPLALLRRKLALEPSIAGGKIV